MALSKLSHLALVLQNLDKNTLKILETLFLEAGASLEAGPSVTESLTQSVSQSHS